MHAPILDTLKRVAATDAVRFYTPGHRGGKHLHPGLAELLERAALADCSCSLPELDVLTQPSSTIKDAQELAAELFRSSEAHFLVNGSTVGNLAMMMAFSAPDDQVMVPVDAHRSVWSGLALAAARPVPISIETLPGFGVPANVSIDAVRDCIEMHPGIRTIVITNPNCWGIAADTAALSSLVRSHGIQLIVDEAHGSHLRFCKSGPASACDFDAAAWVQSWHKTLSSLSQASVLHVGKSPSGESRIAEALGLLQTTSPSYLLLASLDATRHLYAMQGAELVGHASELTASARSAITEFTGLRCLDKEDVAGLGQQLDPTKLVVACPANVSGFEMSRRLRNQGVCCEAWSGSSVLFMLTAGNDGDDVERLLGALAACVPKSSSARALTRTSAQAPVPSSTELCLAPRDLFFGRKRRKYVVQSEGRIAAEPVVVVPPGVPLVLPGQRISTEHVNAVLALPDHTSVNGSARARRARVRVLESPIEECLQTSSHLVEIKVSDRYFLYNSLLGFPTVVGEAAQRILEDYRDPIVPSVLAGSTHKSAAYGRTVEKFVEHYYLSKPGTDERGLLKRLWQQYLAQSPSRLCELFLVLSDRCNFRCHYCIPQVANAANLVRTQDMDVGTALTSVRDFVSMMREHGRTSGAVNFRGGEPLLNKRVLAAVLDEVSRVVDLELTSNLVTNGSLLDRDTAEILARRGVSLQVSLDGHGVAHDKVRRDVSGQRTFDLILENMRRFKEVGGRISSVYTTITGRNWQDVTPSLAPTISELGVTSWVVQPDLAQAWEYEAEEIGEHLLHLRREARGYGVEVSGYWEHPFKNIFRSLLFSSDFAFCGASAGKLITVGCDGGFSLCHYVPFAVADCAGVADAVRSEDIRRYVDSGCFLSRSGCFGCELEGHCRGGCAVTHYQADAGSSVLQFRCRLYKYVTRRLIAEKVEREARRWHST